MSWEGLIIAGVVLLCLLATVAIIIINLYRAVRNAVPHKEDEL